ncbi:MAG: hypothetical protein Alpg2KO_22140 [Alphaproteobacteria bacterium]
MKLLPKLFWGLAGLVALLLTFLLTATIWGSLMPEQHEVSATETYQVPPATVWAAITDFGGQPGWREGLASSVQLSSADEGEEVWREIYKQGNMALDLAVVEQEPEKLLVREVVNSDEAGFSGRWTYELAAGDDGSSTTVTITEVGGVNNTTVRFIFGKLIGNDAPLKTYLADLKGKYQ